MATSSKNDANQAINYRNYNKFAQLIYGKKLIDSLELMPNYDVLAVGCGTGDLAAYVAQTKLKEGKVTAFDPDGERVQQALEQFSHIKNLSFAQGTAIEFLQGKSEEYDLIYSNVVLHWIPKADHLSTFLSFYKALRPGQIMAHQFAVEMPRTLLSLGVLFKPDEVERLKELEQRWANMEIESVAQNCGFEIVRVEKVTEESKFANVDEYLSWVIGTFQSLLEFEMKQRYYDYKDKLHLDEQEDGSIIEKASLVKMIFRKPKD